MIRSVPSVRMKQRIGAGASRNSISPWRSEGNFLRAIIKPRVKFSIEAEPFICNDADSGLCASGIGSHGLHALKPRLSIAASHGIGVRQPSRPPV